MEMKEEVTKRFEELIGRCRRLLETLGPEVVKIDIHGNPTVDAGSYQYWVPKVRIPEFRSWLTSAANLIYHVSPPSSHLTQECNRIMADEHLKQGVSSNVLVLMLGLLTGAKDEWDHGLLGKIEYIVAGATFDDFLDHADEYHKGNKKVEAAVLGSAVLEDTVKKIAQKNGIQTSGKTLDPLVDDLVKANVLTLVKGKRVKAYAGVRNHALHAEWDKFEISDVGELIKGTRELIENYL
jgi:hypothetical protein